MAQRALVICLHGPEIMANTIPRTTEIELIARAAQHYLAYTDEIINKRNQQDPSYKNPITAALYATHYESVVSTFLEATKHEIETIAQVHEPALTVEYSKDVHGHGCAEQFWRAFDARSLLAKFGQFVDFIDRTTSSQTSRIPTLRVIQNDPCVSYVLGRQEYVLRQHVKEYAKRVNEDYYKHIHRGQSFVLLVVLEHGIAPIEPLLYRALGQEIANQGEAHLLSYGIDQANDPVLIPPETILLSPFPEPIPIERST